MLSCYTLTSWLLALMPGESIFFRLFIHFYLKVWAGELYFNHICHSCFPQGLKSYSYGKVLPVEGLWSHTLIPLCWNSFGKVMHLISQKVYWRITCEISIKQSTFENVCVDLCFKNWSNGLMKTFLNVIVLIYLYWLFKTIGLNDIYVAFPQVCWSLLKNLTIL